MYYNNHCLQQLTYKVNTKKTSKQVVVPQQMYREQTEEHHQTKMGEPFSADRTFKSMVFKWWWERIYQNMVG